MFYVKIKGLISLVFNAIDLIRFNNNSPQLFFKKKTQKKKKQEVQFLKKEVPAVNKEKT